MFWTITLLILGLIFLVKGAQSTVKGASALARFFNVSSWVIGLLIVGIGTSIPELSINISSAIRGGEVGVGTILGSNIFNILFILGISSLFVPLTLKKEWVHRDVVLNIFTIAITGFFAFTSIVGGDFLGINHVEGIILLFLFVFWVWYMLRLSKKTQHDKSESDGDEVTLIAAGFLIVVGLVGVYLGGNWVVTGAQAIAQTLGVNEAIISILIIGTGTSFPELAISISAIRKNMGGIAIGNIIGSNIFDFIGIIGISSVFGQIAISPEILFDFGFALFASVLLFVSMIFGKGYVLQKREGIFFILIYITVSLFL